MKSLYSAFILMLTTVTSMGQLVGIDYNSSTSQNEYRSVDPETGATSVLNSFAFSSGFYDTDTFTVDPADNVSYVISSDYKLYTFNFSTGAVIGSPSLDTNIIDLGRSATGLVGIDANQSTGLNELRSVNPLTGATTVLSTFGQAAVNADGFVTDAGANVGYYLDLNSLLSFNLSTGAILSAVTLDTAMETVDVSNHGLVGVDYNSVDQDNEFRAINPTTGKTSLLNTFTFSSGYFMTDIKTDLSTGIAYIESSDSRLYEFDIATGAVIADPNLDVTLQTLGVPEPSNLALIGLITAAFVLYSYPTGLGKFKITRGE